MDELDQAGALVDGVRAVENLTHLPGEPAPPSSRPAPRVVWGGMSDAAIETQGLVREFKKGPRAVDGIDLRVEPGEVYGFLGPNGAGKSTTVHMLTTLLPPTDGRAWVAGHDIVHEGAAVRATIGAALQDAALDPYLTGREHMKLQTALHGMTGAEARERSTALLERVGLEQAADRRVGGYSGGMKRRLDLALALVHRPRILFLDEPTTGSTRRAAARCGRRCSGWPPTAA